MVKIGRPLHTSMPRLPWKMRPKKTISCSGTDLSSIISSVMRAFISALAREPSMMVAGSPGTSFSAVNSITMEVTQIRAARPMRWMT